MKVRYDREVLSLTDVELEKFTRDWVDAKKQSYHEVTRFAGAGDMGRDVVGFLSSSRHEGEWHNYQCKQYSKTLPTETALNEIGKILYFSFLGKFTDPTAYFFVTPRGTNRNLEELIFKPQKFKQEFLNKWEDYCSQKIIANQTIQLNDALRKFIEGYDFSKISRIGLDDILKDKSSKAALFNWFGAEGWLKLDYDDVILKDVGPSALNTKEPQELQRMIQEKNMQNFIQNRGPKPVQRITSSDLINPNINSKQPSVCQGT